MPTDNGYQNVLAISFLVFARIVILLTFLCACLRRRMAEREQDAGGNRVRHVQQQLQGSEAGGRAPSPSSTVAIEVAPVWTAAEPPLVYVHAQESGLLESNTYFAQHLLDL